MAHNVRPENSHNPAASSPAGSIEPFAESVESFGAERQTQQLHAGTASEEEGGATAQERIKETAEKAREAASEAARRVSEQGASFVATQKDRVAEELSHFGRAFREAADSLHDEGDHRIADYAEVAAEQIDRTTKYLRSNDCGRLIQDAEDATRRHPEVVFGGMFIAGLALSRFLKASARNGRHTGRSAQPLSTTAH